MTKSPINRTLPLIASALVFSGLAQSHGQGTMRFNFDSQPRGTCVPGASYSESGMTFWSP